MMGRCVLKRRQILLSEIWTSLRLETEVIVRLSLLFPCVLSIPFLLAHVQHIHPSDVKFHHTPTQGIWIICSSNSSYHTEDLFPIHNSNSCSSTDRSILNFFDQIFTQEIWSSSLVENSVVVLTCILPGVHRYLIEIVFLILSGKHFDGRYGPINIFIRPYFFLYLFKYSFLLFVRSTPRFLYFISYKS